MPTSTNVTNLKINELTEAQYDTAVQGGVIGANELSIITDADYTTISNTTVTLVVNDWSSNTQTVTVQGITSSNTILIAPAPSSNSDYVSAGILCVSQSTNSLTFSCQTVPTNAIIVNVAIFN